VNKTVRWILIIVCCLATALVLVVALNPANHVSPIENEPTEIAHAPASETPAAAPEPSPDPTPVPEPEPLKIEKQTLTFDKLAPATTMTFEELVGDNDVYDENDMPPYPAPDTYKLVINVYHQFAAVYKKDAGGEYTVPVRYIIVSSGAHKTPTPLGTFEMGKSSVRFGEFVSYGVYGQYWRQITRSIFCHSLIYESRNARSYTNSYKELGKRVSHGCVRMLVPDARWIYYNLGPGTVCDIIRGDKEDAEAAAIKAQLIYPEKPSERPALKAGEIPVTEAWPGWQGDANQQYTAYLASLAEPMEDTGDEGQA